MSRKVCRSASPPWRPRTEFDIGMARKHGERQQKRAIGSSGRLAGTVTSRYRGRVPLPTCPKKRKSLGQLCPFVVRLLITLEVIWENRGFNEEGRAQFAPAGLCVMLNLPNDGYKVYEVQLYNEQVRVMAQRRKRHSFFDRHWARAQVRDVVARDESEAWALIAERFPPEDGFVVERITGSRF